MRSVAKGTLLGAALVIALTGCGKGKPLTEQPHDEGGSKELRHQVVLATLFKQDLQAKLPGIDPEKNCIQWVKLVGDDAPEWLEFHKQACPADGSLIQGVIPAFSVKLRQVDRGNTASFFDYDLYVLDAASNQEKVVGRLFFNDTRTEDKAILNGLCQVRSSDPDYDSVCELSEQDSHYRITLK